LNNSILILFYYIH